MGGRLRNLEERKDLFQVTTTLIWPAVSTLSMPYIGNHKPWLPLLLSKKCVFLFPGTGCRKPKSTGPLFMDCKERQPLKLLKTWHYYCLGAARKLVVWRGARRKRMVPKILCQNPSWEWSEAGRVSVFVSLRCGFGCLHWVSSSYDWLQQNSELGQMLCRLSCCWGHCRALLGSWLLDYSILLLQLPANALSR